MQPQLWIASQDRTKIFDLTDRLSKLIVTSDAYLWVCAVKVLGLYSNSYRGLITTNLLQVFSAKLLIKVADVLYFVETCTSTLDDAYVLSQSAWLNQTLCFPTRISLCARLVLSVLLSDNVIDREFEDVGLTPCIKIAGEADRACVACLLYKEKIKIV